ncbi:MAG: hypothetical protein ABH813_02140 [Patescibacteria group bacterium]
MIIKKEIIKLDNEKSVMQFLKQPTSKMAEAITGILASDLKDWKLSAGKLVQSVIKGNFLTQLGREIEKYRAEGKIKEDYFATHKNRATLYELLKFLDEKIPDEELFAAMKSIFFSGISVDSTQREEILAYEFLQTAKELSGTEILILKANFEIAQGKMCEGISVERLKNSGNFRSNWRKIIAKQMGYENFDSIVIKYEENLESLGIISPRLYLERLQNEFETTQKFRLTEVGCKFCEFITNYK